AGAEPGGQSSAEAPMQVPPTSRAESPPRSGQQCPMPLAIRTRRLVAVPPGFAPVRPPMNSRFAAVLAACTLAALAGCEDNDAPAGSSDKGGTSGMIDSAKKAAGDVKDSVVKTANEQVTKIEDYASKLKAQASKIAADQKPEYDKAVAAIDDGMTKLK